MARIDTVTDYPLAENRPDLVKTARGKALQELTLDAVMAGDVTLEDLRITPQALLDQARVATLAGRPTLGRNFERAAELIAVPQDYLNVARVLNLSELTIMRKILFPAVLPYMLTGIRLSIGTAWLVIVAAEMLTGGVGIGFWVWDEWNNLKVEHIIIAIFVIGIVGLLLEQMLVAIAKRFRLVYFNGTAVIAVQAIPAPEPGIIILVHINRRDGAVRKAVFFTNVLVGQWG